MPTEKRFSTLMDMSNNIKRSSMLEYLSDTMVVMFIATYRNFYVDLSMFKTCARNFIFYISINDN
jgi:hypothetical protein